MRFFTRAILLLSCFIFFFFNDTATTEIYTLSLHDALPIYAKHNAKSTLRQQCASPWPAPEVDSHNPRNSKGADSDRKSTRLNSSHLVISYAVFCLKKKTVAAFAPSNASLNCCATIYDCANH